MVVVRGNNRDSAFYEEWLSTVEGFIHRQSVVRLVHDPETAGVNCFFATLYLTWQIHINNWCCKCTTAPGTKPENRSHVWRNSESVQSITRRIPRTWRPLTFICLGNWIMAHQIRPRHTYCSSPLANFSDATILRSSPKGNHRCSARDHGGCTPLRDDREAGDCNTVEECA
jgi:hypothetical protein